MNLFGKKAEKVISEKEWAEIEKKRLKEEKEYAAQQKKAKGEAALEKQRVKEEKKLTPRSMAAGKGMGKGADPWSSYVGSNGAGYFHPRHWRRLGEQYVWYRPS